MRNVRLYSGHRDWQAQGVGIGVQDVVCLKPAMDSLESRSVSPTTSGIETRTALHYWESTESAYTASGCKPAVIRRKR